MSTTEAGDEFRDQVAALLRVAGYSVVTTEILDKHKRLDIRFEQRSFGKPRKYALEAKNWGTPLDRTDLEKIVAGHLSFIMKHEIDELLIVSQMEIRSPAARAFIEETPGVSHQSFREFQETIMGFSDYLDRFILSHNSDGLEEYYISPMLDALRTIESHVDSWIEDETANPIAVIAGYGMGKTSLARHITYKLAKQFQDGVPCRVPVLISLGTISREQSLEGLVGAVLAGNNPSVKNYSFPLFDDLNQAGRFLIILDGFDEMKHMMTQTDFLINFDEINRLSKGKAKVILLGRPTVFLSDNDRVCALRGMLSTGKISARNFAAPVYDEITLTPFSPVQVRSFIKKYIERHQRIGSISAGSEFIDRRQAEIEEKIQESLISRPVHARMLADIATDPSVDILNISRFSLYDHFITHLIKREISKPSRGGVYKAADRRLFACDLAWHMWTQSGISGIGCRIDDLPDELFNPYITQNDDMDSIKRELMSGSFLDEKSGGIYFFSHRSFQEFLVAEYIWNTISDSEASDSIILSIIKYMTQDVFDFIIEREDRAFFRALIGVISRVAAPMSPGFLNILTTSREICSISSQVSKVGFSQLYAAILIADAIKQTTDDSDDILRRAVGLISEKSEKKPVIIMSSIITATYLMRMSGWSVTRIVPWIVSLLFYNADADLEGLSIPATRQSSGENVKDLIFACISSKFERRGSRDLIISVDLNDMNERINQILRAYVLDSNAALSIDDVCEMSFDDCFSKTREEYIPSIKKFYELDARTGINMTR